MDTVVCIIVIVCIVVLTLLNVARFVGKAIKGPDRPTPPVMSKFRVCKEDGAWCVGIDTPDRLTFIIARDTWSDAMLWVDEAVRPAGRSK